MWFLSQNGFYCNTILNHQMCDRIFEEFVMRSLSIFIVVVISQCVRLMSLKHGDSSELVSWAQTLDGCCRVLDFFINGGLMIKSPLTRHFSILHAICLPILFLYYFGVNSPLIFMANNFLVNSYIVLCWLDLHKLHPVSTFFTKILISNKWSKFLFLFSPVKPVKPIKTLGWLGFSEKLAFLKFLFTITYNFFYFCRTIPVLAALLTLLRTVFIRARS